MLLLGESSFLSFLSLSSIMGKLWVMFLLGESSFLDHGVNAHLAHLDGFFLISQGSAGRVLLSSSSRTRAISWVTVTPTPIMSSLICWCRVVLGRPHRLVPGTVRSLTLSVVHIASLDMSKPMKMTLRNWCKMLYVSNIFVSMCSSLNIPIFSSIFE